MKKKIAIFASGWASQILSQFLNGLSSYLKDKSIDTYLFLCYPSWATTEEERHGEFNILRLPDIKTFDGAIIVSNGLEFNDQINYLMDKCLENHTPTVSVGIKREGLFYVGVDNTRGMQELCEHIINEHNIKNPFFLAGSKDNADSNLRLEVLKETLKKHKLSFNKKWIFYTNWENSRTYDFVDSLCKSGKKMPDSFVCANDGVAMNTCMALEDNGYTIPNDIIVTGFDNTAEAATFAPSISSVNQNYTILGYESAKLLDDFFHNITRENEIIIPCSFFPSESCCHSKDAEINGLRKKRNRTNYANRVLEILLDRKLNNMERKLLQGKNFEDMRKNLTEAITGENQIEGDSFHILIDPTFEISIYDNSVELITDGYSSKLQVAFSMDKGVISDQKEMNTCDLIPNHTDTNEGRFYIFLPIHNEDKTFGYYVICDCISRIDSHFFANYQQRLNIAFERYRQKLSLDELNRQLTRLSRIDPLTHVKNRMSFDERTNELMMEIKTGANPKFAIAMFDVNNLKTVNDEFGHDSGDLYIINSCRLICHTFKHSSVFRIGGDEFLAILMNEDLLNWHELLSDINTRIKSLEGQFIPEVEKVNFACGITEYDPKKDKTVQDVVKRADTIMYKNKMAMKGGRVR